MSIALVSSHFLNNNIDQQPHSFCSLTTGPQSLPKPFLHTVRSSASCFNFKYPIFFLKPSSNCLHLLPRLSVTSILPSFTQYRVLQGSSYTTCDQSSYPSSYLLYAGHSFPPWLFITLLHFSCDRSNWSSSSFSSTTSHTFPGISDLLSEMPKFQHHTKLCFKFGPLLVSCLNFCPICWWKHFFLFLNTALCLGNPGFNFTSILHAFQIPVSIHL